MRSACSATRSMSFETLFDVWPNCLLALPTLLATDWMSTFETRGTGTPRIFFRREWPFSTIPPAIPTAVAPTATAGPLTLLAAPLIVPTTPPFPVPFRLAALRLEPALPVLRPAPLRLPPRLAAGCFRALPFPDVDREAFDVDREAFDRLLAAAFGRLRDEALFELGRLRDDALFELPLAEDLDLDLGLGFDPEPLDVARVAPRPLRAAGWLAILFPSVENVGSQQRLPKRRSSQSFAGVSTRAAVDQAGFG